MHLRTIRDRTLTPKEMPLTFAHDILGLWVEFSKKSRLHSKYKAALDKARKDSIDEASSIAKNPPFNMEALFFHE